MNKKSEKSNEKFLEKIVKKNYNNELEKILEKKAYSEDTKSLLLNMFYKIDIGYKDYKEVKINVETKENYVEEILRIILNKCNDIRIIGINSEEAKILGKPIVITNYPTAKSQIEHLVDGYITELSCKGIADGIERLYKDSELRDTMAAKCKRNSYDNNFELDKLYKVF